MNCKDARELFSEYYDNYSPSTVPGANLYVGLEEHLESCPSCMEAFKEYVELFDQVRALPAPDTPEFLHELLMDHVTMKKTAHMPTGQAVRNYQMLNKQPQKRPKPLYMKIAPIVAVAASLIFAVVWFSGMFGQPQYPAPVENGYISIQPFGGDMGLIDPRARTLPGEPQAPDVTIGFAPAIGNLTIDEGYGLLETYDPPTNRMGATALAIIISIILIGVIASAAVMFTRPKN